MSVTGVNGWCSANARSPAGIDSVGTNPLPSGRRTSSIGVLLAVSTLLAERPMATDSQTRAKVAIARTPTAAIHSTTVASERNPTSTATARTIARPTMVWMRLLRTCPVSTEPRAIDMVRNRAMIPSFMSMATAMAVPWAALAMPMIRMPGVTKLTYSARPPAVPPSPAPSVPPKTKTNSSRSTTGIAATITVSAG